jgi:hypothetical protein
VDQEISNEVRFRASGNFDFPFSGRNASVIYWLEFLATDPEVPGSINVATRFSEK